MIHLLKLCVGVNSVDELAKWQAKRAKERKGQGLDPRPRHRTRNMPRRRDELLDGGSLYWVIRNQIQARQIIKEINRGTDAEGNAWAELVFDPKLTPTTPVPRRPFQGWRYLPTTDAPADLVRVSGGLEALPAAVQFVLRDLGVR